LGFFAGTVFLGTRYVVITSLFAIVIDSDHIIAFLHLDALAKTSHSITFGVIAAVVLMILFGRKDYKLGAAALAGVFSHISFDTFSIENAKFPLCTIP
jgi:hypothetical protein